MLENLQRFLTAGKKAAVKNHFFFALKRAQKQFNDRALE
jgi:hypothetical protein